MAADTSRRVGRILIAVASFVAIGLVARAVVAAGTATLYVSATSSCTTGCVNTCGCTSTCGNQALPYKTIQDAINDANCQILAGSVTGATVQVGVGNYPERIFIYPNVHVQCVSPSNTTIDATGKGRAAVVFASGGVTRPRVDFSIDSCKITGGSGEMRSAEQKVAGGGVFIFGDAVVSNNLITGNVLAGAQPNWTGAGIYVAYGDPTIRGNTITKNVATPPPIGGQTDAFAVGGGIFVLGSLSNNPTHVRIEGNFIADNLADAEIGKGGGMMVDGNPGSIVTRNIIVGNRASHSAGGIMSYGTITLDDNLIYGNSASVFGGGIFTYTAVAQITNNTIYGNSLTDPSTPSGYSFANYGGGVCLTAIIQQSPPVSSVTNNLIFGNSVTAAGTGGGLDTMLTSPPIKNNDLWNNLKLPSTINNVSGDFTEAQVIGVSGNVSVDPRVVRAPAFTDVTIAAGTTTTVAVSSVTRYVTNQIIEYNDDAVPRTITAINATSKVLTFTPALTAASKAWKLLANWGTSTNVSEDFHLLAGSPLIDAGTNTGVGPLDLDGNPRLSDGNSDGTATADIGAYEVTPADTDGDGVPNPLDCAPSTNSVWTPPGPVGATLKSGIGAPTPMGWGKISQANIFNVYRGTIATPNTGLNHICFEPGSPDRMAQDGANPPVGTAFYYLVSGVNSCGEGCLGLNAAACEIPPPTPGSGAACVLPGTDIDADGVDDIADDCPLVSNSGQIDTDKDGVGEVCDNCAGVANPDQADANGDGIGDKCQDSDGDGYKADVDCNDSNPAVNPGAVETCNNIDDDCDGQVDEQLGTLSCGAGACARTVNACVGGVPQTCTPGTPGIETCNNIDDDCDGQVDEQLGTLSCGTGACGRTVNACVDGVSQTCTPGAPGIEICNNIDDDCDGQVDEQLGTLSCGTGACARTVNACVGGVSQTCTPGAPGTETCNNIDDDCDGVVDDGFDLDGDGYTTCGGDCNDQAASINPAAAETCNGLDDNCSGVADEGFLDSDRDFLADCVDPDDDNDLVPDLSDCAPLTSSVSAIPGEVGPTVLAVAGAVPPSYAWTPIAQANVHNVYRTVWDGRVGGPFDGTICLSAETSRASFNDSAVPPVGSIFYYLITGTNRCGEGTPGTMSSGQPEPIPPAALCAHTGLDTDLDGVLDIDDDCPLLSNPLQADADHDGRGDLCDNCPAVQNPGQVDSDGNGVGDACQTP